MAAKVKFVSRILILLIVPGLVFAQSGTSDDMALAKTSGAVAEIAVSSFPDIKPEKIKIKSFRSSDSFFKARFSLGRFLTFRRMRHLVYVNPEAFDRSIPENGFRAILAHELAHVAYYTRKNRLQLLGLVRLTGSSARSGFERKADLDAIQRGYGKGLIEYREWLYKQISSDQVAVKKKVYFSPPEITLLIKAAAEKPELINKWKEDVPRSIEEIRRDTGYD